MTEPTVTRALARVFESEVTFVVRPDTPLASFGPIDQAWVLVAQAIVEEAAGRGMVIAIADSDICEVHTFGELVQLVEKLSSTYVQVTS
jgi:hypothetical protein